MYLRRGLSGIVQDISAAITRQENVAAQYHNPGGLIAAPGCTARPGQIAICPDDATGYAALERQVQLYIDRGYTLSGMLNKWAPASCAGTLCIGNDPSAYTRNVAAWTGIDPLTPLNQVSPVASSGGLGPETSDPASDVFFDMSELNTWEISPVTLAIAAGVVVVAFLVARS